MRKSVSVAVALALLMCPGLVSAQNATIHPNTAVPPSSEAEKNAFQTPTAGKNSRQNSSGSTSGNGSGNSDSNPEARLSDHGPKNVQPEKPPGNGSTK